MGSNSCHQFLYTIQTKSCHLQFSESSGNSHIVMRLSIDSVPQKHTLSLTGDTIFAGNFGLWQGPLGAT